MKNIYNKIYTFFPRLAFQAGDRHLKNRHYSKNTEQELKLAAFNAKETRYASRLIDFLTQKYGYTSPLTLNSTKKLLKNKSNLHSKNFILKILPILYLQNETFLLEKALFLLRSYKTPKKNTACVDHIINQSDFTQLTSPTHKKDIYKQITTTTTALEKEFCEKHNSICIVGNSPSILNSKKGEYIDQHKIVIRFNEFSLDGLEVDTGSKTDIWVVNKGLLSDSDLKKKRIHVPKWICCSNNYLYKSKNYNSELFEPMLASIQTSVIPPWVFHNIIAKTGALPSSGLAILYWIYITTGKPIPKKNILGFSHFGDSNFQDHYFTGLDEKKHLHDWDAEKYIIKEIIK